MMDIYVIDVGDIKPGLDPEMGAKADVIQYWANLIRGCTDNRMIMKQYLDFMNQIIGEYVELNVYQYHMDYVQTDMSTEEYMKTVQEFAMIEYIKELSHSENSEDWKRADGIHELQMLMKLDTENGGPFITTEDMQDEITMYHGDEKELLEKVMYLFSQLNKYIYSMGEPILTLFRDKLFDYLPALLKDCYDSSAPIMLDIIYVMMLDVIDLKFIN